MSSWLLGNNNNNQGGNDEETFPSTSIETFFSLATTTNNDNNRHNRLQSSQLPPSSSAEPVFLTIAVDRRHSCPNSCTFAHPFLPTWVRYRYIDFEDETDLAAVIMNNNDTKIITRHHLLIVARTNIVKLGNFARRRRLMHNVSTGLWHMADERFHRPEILHYPKFDYVIRNYYHPDFYQNNNNMTLQAFGNLTCGTTATTAQLSTADNIKNNKNEPWLGIHWAFLFDHDLHVLLRRPSASTVWPIAFRPNNCSFVGRHDCKRSQGTRRAMNETFFTTEMAELNCQIAFTKGFAKGNSKFQYINDDVGNSKIGLCPGGANVETHRLAELLQMGTVPAMLDKAYLHAPFQNVPAIVGKTWTDVGLEMKRLLQDEANGGTELEILSRRGAQFYQDLLECMKADMDVMLRRAFFE